MKPCLAVMVKQPDPGAVKTRIAATLGDQRATELYQCALHDTIALALTIPEVARAISYAPATDSARRYFESAAPAFELMEQRGSTLGERISDTLSRLLNNYSPLVLIGSDSPDLPSQNIMRALQMLDETIDAVLGPAADGGYYLIGLRSMHDCLFDQIDWSTPAVAQQTRARAAAAGLRMAELPVWRDLDTVADLQALVEPGAPLTRAFVAALNVKDPDENKSSGCMESR